MSHSPAPPPQISNNTNNNSNTHSNTSPAQLAHILSTVLTDNDTLSKDLAVARARYERAEQTLALLKPPHTSVTATSDVPSPLSYPDLSPSVVSPLPEPEPAPGSSPVTPVDPHTQHLANMARIGSFQLLDPAGDGEWIPRFRSRESSSFYLSDLPRQWERERNAPTSLSISSRIPKSPDKLHPTLPSWIKNMSRISGLTA